MKLDLISMLETATRTDIGSLSAPLPPLLMWGGFIFQLSTLAFNKLQLSESWNWASQPRIGKMDMLMFTGQKVPTLRFDCELYADFVNIAGLDDLLLDGWVDSQVDPVEWLRQQAGMRTPLMLVTGFGKVMGYWVMTQIDQAVDAFQGAGEYRHQQVTLSMQYFGPALNAVDGDTATVTTPDTASTQEATSQFQAYREGNIDV